MSIAKPDGGPISTAREAVCLGGLITCDGKAASELSRRIGDATGVFNRLRKMRPHSSMGLARKMKIYETSVLSKLLCFLDCLATTR
eukprot:7809596-Pyramimonas_sp.AAC.1